MPVMKSHGSHFLERNQLLSLHLSQPQLLQAMIDILQWKGRNNIEMVMGRRLQWTDSVCPSLQTIAWQAAATTAMPTPL
jgi:hypothetical protein